MTLSTESSRLLQTVDERTRIAGSNRMEILLFSLGGSEMFGINVFKVREIMWTPPITRAPNLPPGVVGVTSLRGNIIPVIALAEFVHGDDSCGERGTMMVTEFSRHTQGFLVHEVDRIVRVDWDEVRPQPASHGNSELITALTELPDGKLVSILDVEQVLARVLGETAIPELAAIETAMPATVLFADDSLVARKEIIQVLERLGVQYQQASTGAEAWERLQTMAAAAQSEGAPLSARLNVILTDAEMPAMDGYVLTRKIKADARFAGIPVVMHSSLSSETNRAMGKSVGVDAYVPKFDPVMLADTLRPMLARRAAVN
jgi:two-component system, chemotaxis family, chemotaxis protein CheV